MRVRGLAAVLPTIVLPIATGCGDWTNGGARRKAPIGREVRVAGGTITLGAPLPAEVRAAARATLGDTLVALPPGSSVAARVVRVSLSPGGIVTAVTLDHDFGADFEAMVADSAAPLGQPQRTRTQRRGEEPADVAYWRDPRTEIGMIRDPNRSAWVVRSVLLDRSAPRDRGPDSARR